MPFFTSRRSLTHLIESKSWLQKLSQRVIQRVDHSIIDATRSDAEQMQKFIQKLSKARPGESPHNYEPSLAIDVIPYPFPWEDWDHPDAVVAFKRVRDEYERSLEELKLEGEIPSYVELEFGFDWGWDKPHIQIKNWRQYV